MSKDCTSVFEADYVARQLCTKAPLVEGWQWTRHRRPPLPFYENHDLLPAAHGYCRICAGPVYADGAHFGSHLSKRTWHNICLKAFTFWTQPDANVLGPRQQWACASCGRDLSRERSSGPCFADVAQVDHIVPLYRVWRDLRGLHWTELLHYWSPDNCQVLCVACHKLKCSAEAGERAAFRADGPQLVLI
jgi:5-methylcytosine-specific restriction endonuclease McrA